MAEPYKQCDACLETNIKNTDIKCAVGYCIECTEHLCQTCIDCHKVPRPCRNHTLIAVSDPQYKTYITDTTGHSKLIQDVMVEVCRQHDSYYTEYFCTNHKQTCCANCWIEEHQGCNITKLRDVNKDILYGCEAENYLGRLREVHDTIHKLDPQTDEILKKILQSKSRCSEDKKKFRKELDARIDFLQLDTDKALEEKHNMPVIKQWCTDLREVVETKLEELETYRDNKLSGKMYVALQHCENEMDIIQAKLTTVKSNMTLHVYDFIPDSQLHSSLFQDVTSFGKLDERVFGSDEDQLSNVTCEESRHLTQHEVCFFTILWKQMKYMCSLKIKRELD